MLKIIFTILISLIANETFAVCSSVAIDDNSRIISLAKDFADQADFEFKKANTLRKHRNRSSKLIVELKKFNG